MKNLVFLFFLLSFYAKTSAQETYDYPTKLKNGYHILPVFTKTDLDLYLKKGKKTIKLITSGDKNMLQKNIGYVGADFTDYFVFVHSYGSGNPHSIELIQKSNGKVIINDVAWIDADEKQEYLLYSNNDVPDLKNKMTLYHVKTKKKEYFSFPADIFDGSMVLNRIKIKKIETHQLTINYELNDGTEKTKTYKR